MTIEVKGLGKITADHESLSKLIDALNMAGYKFYYDIEWVDDEDREFYKSMSEWCYDTEDAIYQAMKGAKNNG